MNPRGDQLRSAFFTGKFQYLCECTDTLVAAAYQQTGAIEVFVDPTSHLSFPVCSVPMFNASGVLEATNACRAWSPITKP